MDSKCEKTIRTWLAEIEGPRFDPARAAQAARDLATCLDNSPHMVHLLRALAEGREDRLSCDACQALLPEYIHVQLNFDPGASSERPNREVTNHLAQCPYCVAAYAEATELVLAYTDFAIPAAASYPAFDVLPANPASQVATAPAWATDIVRRAIAEGKQWVEDTLGGVYLLFQPSGQGQPALAWGIKAGEPGALLAQTVWVEPEGEGWEIEASAFADAQRSDLCRVEVAVYRVGDPDAVLAGMTVMLRGHEILQTRTTDESGIVEFIEIPKAELAEAAIRVSLPGRDA
jgi:hypothetical protein